MTLSLRQDGSTLTGTYTFKDEGESGSAPIRGNVSGRNFRFTGNDGTDEASFVGTVAEDCRTLSATMSAAGESVTVTFRRR